MSGLVHKVKDVLQGGHKDGVFSLSFPFQINSIISFHILIFPLQRQQSSSMMASKESTVASLAFMIPPSQDPSHMVTLYPPQILVSSIPPSVASTVTVTPAHLAPASPINSSLGRPASRVSPDPLPTAAPFLLPILVSFIPLSLASMALEMPGLGVRAFRTLS